MGDVKLDNYKDPTTLYRGLGLPAKAIGVYRQLLESRIPFGFTGFTSTSLERGAALQFAYTALAKGEVPVLFVLEARHTDGYRKAFLHDEALSAFPEEKEYLLGN